MLRLKQSVVTKPRCHKTVFQGQSLNVQGGSVMLLPNAGASIGAYIGQSVLMILICTNLNYHCY